MVRKIIKINESKCNGCGACVDACHEGAIAILNGKAKLLREDYCDGLGDCLPVCPENAITFEERKALTYNEEAVLQSKQHDGALPCGCPGSNTKTIKHECIHHSINAIGSANTEYETMLSQWPVQIKLVPVNAPYFDSSNLLIAADCTAYAYGDFHRRFMRNHITLIGCPKLDGCDYADKLTQIISSNDIKSVTIVRMEVPCCAGIENAVKRALISSGKFIPWQVKTISLDGNIIE